MNHRKFKLSVPTAATSSSPGSLSERWIQLLMFWLSISNKVLLCAC